MKQIYRFLPEEIKELTYRQLKVLSVIRQFNQYGLSTVNADEVTERTGIIRTHVLAEIRFLIANDYISKHDEGYVINKEIPKKTEYLYWEDKDLELKLTYNQFALYCLIRSRAKKLGYAMLKYSTITDLIGIKDNNLPRIIKQLVEKDLIRTEKEKTYTKYYLVEEESTEDYDDEEEVDSPTVEEEQTIESVEEQKESTVDIIDVLDYLTYLGLKRCEEHSSVYYRIKGFAEGFKITYDEILEIIKDEEEEFKKLADLTLPADKVYDLLDSYV